MICALGTRPRSCAGSVTVGNGRCVGYGVRLGSGVYVGWNVYVGRGVSLAVGRGVQVTATVLAGMVGAAVPVGVL